MICGKQCFQIKVSEPKISYISENGVRFSVVFVIPHVSLLTAHGKSLELEFEHLRSVEGVVDKVPNTVSQMCRVRTFFRGEGVLLDFAWHSQPTG